MSRLHALLHSAPHPHAVHMGRALFGQWVRATGPGPSIAVVALTPPIECPGCQTPVCDGADEADPCGSRVGEKGIVPVAGAADQSMMRQVDANCAE